MSWSSGYCVSRIALASASLLIAAFTSSSFAQSQSQQVQQRNTCLGANNSLSTRLPACAAIIEANRESSSVISTAHTVRGDAAREKNDFDAAIEEYNEAIKLDARNGAAYYGRGISRTAKNEMDAAIADFDLAVQHDPRNASAWKVRAVAYYNKLDYKTSINDLNQALRI